MDNKKRMVKGKVKISLLQAVEAPTLFRQMANRWQQGCQPHFTPRLLF
jgi:stalled ribosome alternative rescue factor ArfA